MRGAGMAGGALSWPPPRRRLIMASEVNVPRRIRVERNIYRRANGVFEVGFKDGTGRQRWRTIDRGITVARAARDQLLAASIAANPRFRAHDFAFPKPPRRGSPVP